MTFSLATSTEIRHEGRILFSEKELRCKASGKILLAPGFADRLTTLRLTYGKPMVVNSCCRSAEHNANVGGNARSLHVYDKPFWPTGGCCAIDISVTDATHRARLARMALDLGWWVGVHEQFLHLDRRMDFGIADAVGIFVY